MARGLCIDSKLLGPGEVVALLARVLAQGSHTAVLLPFVLALIPSLKVVVQPIWRDGIVFGEEEDLHLVMKLRIMAIVRNRLAPVRRHDPSCKTVPEQVDWPVRILLLPRALVGVLLLLFLLLLPSREVVRIPGLEELPRITAGGLKGQPSVDQHWQVMVLGTLAVEGCREGAGVQFDLVHGLSCSNDDVTDMRRDCVGTPDLVWLQMVRNNDVVQD
mmetsp:Transcript_58594/g.137200  ORF Transcript_58594/g.137200 Transcript_58594/m.137200 type:complete len:217 (+) Transcript_58594:290-940(+)